MDTNPGAIIIATDLTRPHAEELIAQAKYAAPTFVVHTSEATYSALPGVTNLSCYGKAHYPKWINTAVKEVSGGPLLVVSDTVRANEYTLKEALELTRRADIFTLPMVGGVTPIISGHFFGVNLDSDRKLLLRGGKLLDEKYRWWNSDTDLLLRARKANARILVSRLPIRSIRSLKEPPFPPELEHEVGQDMLLLAQRWRDGDTSGLPYNPTSQEAKP